MSPKSTADEALVARNRATAIATIKGYNKVADLKAFLKRLERYPQLDDLIPLCERRIAEVTASRHVARNDELLPDPFPHDHERAPLRDYWVQAAAEIGSVGSRTLQMVRRRGYRDTMLKQLKPLKEIGSNRFITLKDHSLIHFSAEYLMRKYYSDMLTEAQKRKIDQVLNA